MILLNQPCRVIPQGSSCLFRPEWMFRKVIFCRSPFYYLIQSTMCTTPRALVSRGLEGMGLPACHLEHSSLTTRWTSALYQARCQTQALRQRPAWADTLAFWSLCSYGEDGLSKQNNYGSTVDLWRNQLGWCNKEQWRRGWSRKGSLSQDIPADPEGGEGASWARGERPANKGLLSLPSLLWDNNSPSGLLYPLDDRKPEVYLKYCLKLARCDVWRFRALSWVIEQFQRSISFCRPPAGAWGWYSDCRKGVLRHSPPGSRQPGENTENNLVDPQALRGEITSWL